MSIKSLFEDIADAIREKSGSSDTYTPAEMPSAIRSIPSGSSTASGVSYDNTSSGLTANNVQDAIDELAEDVSTINSDLSELKDPTYKPGTTITIINGTTSDQSIIFTAPQDGYIIFYMNRATAGTGLATVRLNGLNDITVLTVFHGANSGIFVRKGLEYSIDILGLSGSASAYFKPVQLV